LLASECSIYDSLRVSRRIAVASYGKAIDRLAFTARPGPARPAPLRQLLNRS
jgi:hypothetical protein